MSHVGQETDLISVWIKQRFADAAIVSALNGLWSDLSQRIYEDVAPSTSAYPYIVFQPQSPPDVVRGVGSAEVMVDTIYTVKAVTQGVDDKVTGPVAAVIHQAMVESNGDPVDGGIGTVFMSRRVSVVRYTEPAQGSQFRHLGGAYQIQAQAL